MKLSFNKKTLYLFTLLALLGFFGKMVFATPPLSFYTQGETLDPTCGPTDLNCNVAYPLTAASISDDVYDEATWDGVTTIAPSKNAIRDKIETLATISHNAVTIGTANGLSLATQVLSLALASTSTTGALSDTDWDTFNNKQDALSGTGFVKISGTTISYDNSTYLTSVGTGVANELTYWSGTNALGSLATATYPSLTELSYVKGVTSAIQSQLNGKASTTAYTLAGVSALSITTPNSLYTMTSTIPVNFQRSGGASLLYLDETNGNVGIGTTAPLTNLQVLGAFSEPNAFAAIAKPAVFKIATTATNSLNFGGSNILPYTMWIQSQDSTTSADTYPLALNPVGGNVGIGTMTPATTLEVAGTTRITGSNNALQLTGTNAYIYVNDAGVINNFGSNFLGTQTADDLTFRTTNLARMTIQAGGNVGIGTTTPQSKLHIFNGSAGSFPTIANATAILENSTHNYLYLLGPDASARGIFFGSPTDTTMGGILYNYSVGDGFEFKTNGSAKVWLTSLGHFGIGTSTPQSMLDVEGGVAIGATYSGTTAAPTNGLIVEGNVGIGTTAPLSKLSLVSTDNLIATDIVKFTFDGSNNYRSGIGVAFSDGVPADNELTFRVSNGTTTGQTTVMTMEGTGNVGIGTTAPTSTLEVNGVSGVTPFSVYGFANAAVSSWYQGGTFLGSLTGDINGNLELRAANGLGLGGGINNNQVFITTTGNMGIGTTTPATKFTNASTDSSDAAGIGTMGDAGLLWSVGSSLGYVANINNSLATDNNSNGLLVKTAATGTSSYIAKFESGGTNKMTIRADGNVGIGTTAPLSKLDIRDGVSSTAIRAYKTDDGAGNTEWLEFTANDSYWGMPGIFTRQAGSGGLQGLTIGTGAVGPSLSLNPSGDGTLNYSGSAILHWDATHLYPSTALNNAVDLGYTGGSNNFRTGYFGTSVISPHFYGGTLTTADALADNYLATSATTQKGLVIQAKASQTAPLQEWQASNGGIMAYVDYAGGVHGTDIASTGNVSAGNAFYFPTSDLLMYATGAVSDTGNAYTFADATGTNLRQIKASSLLVRSTLSGTTLAEINNAGAISGTKLGVLEGGATPTKYTYFQGGDQAIDLTYTLPTAYPGVTGYVLTADTSGVMSWAANGVGSGASAALDNLASVAMNANLQWNNAAARTFDIASTANTVVGRALTISAGSTITGGTADMAGGNLTLNSGLGKGTGASSIIFQTGRTLTTGSTLQTLTTAMTILGSGNVGIGTATPTALLNVSGAGVAAAPGASLIIINNTTGAPAAEAGIGFTHYTNGAGTGNFAGSARINSYLDSGGATAQLRFYTGGATPTTRMTIDGVNGYVGIGVTAPSTVLEVVTSGSHGISLGQDTVTATNSGRLFFKASGGTYGIMNEGNILTFRSGATVGSSSGTARVALSAAGGLSLGSTYYSTDAGANNLIIQGNIGIGTTSPTQLLDVVGGSAPAIAVYDNSSAFIGGGGTILLQHTNSSSARVSYAGLNAYATNGSPGAESGDLVFKTRNVGTLAERARILSSGNFGIGATVPANLLHVTGTPAAGTHTARIANTLGGTTQNNGLLVLAGNNTGVAASELITFQRTDATVIGSISQNAATTVAYNLSSDRRIKENITPTAYGLADLLKINVTDFTFISDSTQQKMTGFIAQDLNNIFPGAVTMNGDDGTGALALGATPWMIDYSKLTPLLVKAVQDLNLNLEGIAGTITPLEGSASETFVTAFWENLKNKIGTWLADAGNGVAKIFTGEIDSQKSSTETLCVKNATGETCITRDQLDALLINAGATPAPTPDPMPAPDPDPTPSPLPGGGGGEVIPDPEVTPDPVPEPEVIPEPTPEPEVTPEPEPTPDSASSPQADPTPTP